MNNFDNDPYNSFKSGIKNDVRSFAINQFAGIGIVLLIIAMAMALTWAYGKHYEHDTSTKVITTIIIVGLAIGMLVSREITNVVVRLWLALLVLVVTGIFVTICGWFIYAVMGSFWKDNF